MMDDKTPGIDFDRQPFVQTPPAKHPTPSILGILAAVAVIAIITLAAVKLFPQLVRSSDSDSASDQALTNIEDRLATMEQRLERLEATRRAAPMPAAERPGLSKETPPSGQSAHTIYRISPAPAQPAHPAPAPAADPLLAQRLSSIQRGLGALESDQAESHNAWQATSNRLADVAGQVGTQGVQILRSQDELNDLINRTEVQSIPFELRRGSDPMQVGPISLLLKSVDVKQQRYTLCIYLNPSCIQLKNRVLYEVVRFVVTRDTRPLEVVATKISKDDILGYLEVPKVQTEH
jgi:hypothetical protein